MIFPLLFSGIKKRRQIVVINQKCTYVTAFVIVTMRTSPCKVFKFIAPSVFDTDDVAYFKS